MAYRTSSVTTPKRVSVFGPKVIVIGTSQASRPLAIGPRPMRGLLWRAAKVGHWQPRQTPNEALKSIGDGTGGMPMSPR